MSEYEIIEFKNDNIELSVKVSPKEDTVWLTQKQMSILYDTSIDNISLHIKSIFKDLELDDSVVEETSVTASDGKTICWFWFDEIERMSFAFSKLK